MKHLTLYMDAMNAFPDKWASPFSEEININTASDAVAPNAPSDVGIAEIVDGLVLGWINPALNEDDTACNDLAWIRVYRSTSADIDITDPETYDAKLMVQGESYTFDSGASYGAGRYYQCVLSATGCADATTSYDRGYRGRTQIAHYFVVTAIDRTGNESIASSEVSGTPEAVSTDDTDAVHVNAAAEISAVAVKSAPVPGDYLLIEDSEDDDAKAHVTLGSITTDRYMYVRILEADTDHEVADKVGGDVVLLEALTVLEVGAFSDVAGTTSVTTLDILENGTTILSTKVTIDATEKSSRDAAAEPVVSDTALAANSILTFNIDGIASGTVGKGMTVWLKVRF